MSHRFGLRVYYEDTDLAGIVYYANYLKFIERARSEWVRALGVDQVALKADHGIVFAVRRVEADYLSPARFDDLLEVDTSLQALSGARIALCQEVLRGTDRLFTAAVTLVCLTEKGAPVRIPADIRRVLSAAVETSRR
ncbi:thioesterase [Defluviimonas sp. 20V17]|uniref:Acyl-CoA thioester hydrolase n=1 Tax=Allgaiera indica TaxID=765699 RepID=A0AAN4UU36_9RHOB|nr:tol-pal system-associated acyl-CoA thioesterase [Allgaiera indica]KDB05470.1 thioesterase [Defluviimonas sp. 20V17]GHE04660.1 tol-pal system-associated acyl-CoA thioesterase [Allgaiera indica]SDX47649.1 acyl-CoA thioester hydrolase [Allgaiera indica]